MRGDLQDIQVTFRGNQLAMATGYASLKIMRDETMHKMRKNVANILNEAAHENGLLSPLREKSRRISHKI